MSAYLSQDERDELQSLKQDLLGPVKSFAAEVGKDTVGDAKRFYADKARKAQQGAALAKEKARRQAEELRREQERMRRRLRVMVKRTLIVLALIALFCVAVLYIALAAHAEVPCAEAARPDRRGRDGRSGANTKALKKA